MFPDSHFDAAHTGPSRNPHPPGSSRSWSWMRSVSYGVVATGWGFWSADILAQTEMITGTPCPVLGGWRILVPCMQLAICTLDACICLRLSQIVQKIEEREDVIDMVFKLSLASWLSICLVAFSSWVFESIQSARVSLSGLFRIQDVDVRDLTLDSLLVSALVLCGLWLMSTLNITVVGLILSGSSFIGGQLSPARTSNVFSVEAWASFAVLWCMTVDSPQSRRWPPAALHRGLCVLHPGLMIFCWIRLSMLPDGPKQASMAQVVHRLVDTANLESQRWAAQAAKSKTLNEAWYGFAVEAASPIIDGFDQINRDLLPLWGVDPAAIRSETRHLLEYAKLEMGGIRIRNGSLEKAENVPGSHRWMLDTIERMIDPFIQWLPDIDLAINLSDESRLAVPFGDMEALEARARDSLQRFGHTSNTTAAWPGRQWPDTLPQPADLRQRLSLSPHFANARHRQMYYDVVATTCPPQSRARRSRWWNWAMVCTECSAPHSLTTAQGTILANASLGRDPCHQPDLAYLNGFFISSSNTIVTRSLGTLMTTRAFIATKTTYPAMIK
ncbi:hypothetical protein CDD83_10777 [Cordyceps sp. RAO-2017]|nr:hypothetical protein CDD83_10777 [Cordyceps sp. RAO-2017]